MTPHMELGKSKKQQLADQWAPLRWSRYVELPFRKLVWLLVLNISEEVVVFLYQLMTRPAFVVSVLASILFAWLGATKLDYVKVGEVGAVLLIALLTLGVTAVIFIATLMNDRAQESQRKIDEIKKVLKKYSAPILRGISQAITHGATHDAYSSRQLINLYILMKVGDQQDVPYLLELVNKDRARFPSVYQNFDLQNRVKEAYESCGQVRNMVSLLITLPIEVIGQTEHNEAGTLYEELTGGL